MMVLNKFLRTDKHTFFCIYREKCVVQKPKLIYFNFNNLALIATITVLKLINIAPNAGLNMK